MSRRKDFSFAPSIEECRAVASKIGYSLSDCSLGLVPDYTPSEVLEMRERLWEIENEDCKACLVSKPLCDECHLMDMEYELELDYLVMLGVKI